MTKCVVVIDVQSGFKSLCDDEEIKKKIDVMHINNMHKLNPMPSFDIEEYI